MNSLCQPTSGRDGTGCRVRLGMTRLSCPEGSASKDDLFSENQKNVENEKAKKLIRDT